MSIDGTSRRRLAIDGVGKGIHATGHRAMACDWELFIAWHDGDYAGHVARAVFAEVDRVERELSRFIPHSDVAAINRLAAGESLCVGMETIECLDLAGRLRAETFGAFDITAAILREDGRTDTSTDAQINSRPMCSAPITPGVPGLQVDRAKRLVRSTYGRSSIDLGGIGKGYAIDGAVAILRSWSIDCALIHAGQSTAYALGRPPDSPTWRVSIRDPRDHSRSLGLVPLSGRAVSGSGVAVHGAHIIDPRRGGPAKGALGAWAFAASAAVADALSTAFMILSVDEVEAYCRDHAEASALILADDPPQGPSLLSFGQVALLSE